MLRTSLSLLALLVVTACGDNTRPATDHDATIGGDASDAAIDASPDAPASTHNWAVASISSTSGSALQVFPFDDTGLGAPCPLTAAVDRYNDLVAHPSLPYVYAIESRFEGIAVSCAQVTSTTFPDLGVPRTVQRIRFDAPSSVGFFTIDGTGTTGVYRFEAGSDGTPTVLDSAAAPTGSGAMALDGSGAHLYIGGTSQVADFALIAGLDFSSAYEQAASCAAPTDLVLSGDSVLAFCSDDDNVWRYTRSPFAFDALVGTLGAIDRVVALPHDRALAAVSSSASLQLLTLGAGTPSWTAGPSFASRVTAMAVSRDGRFVVTGRAVDASTSELAEFEIDGQDNFTPLGTMTVDGTINSLAVVPSGS